MDIGDCVKIQTTYAGNYHGKSGKIIGIEKEGMFAGWYRVRFVPSFEIDGYEYKEDIFRPSELTQITE